jgi:transcription elongation factor SPT6
MEANPKRAMYAFCINREYPGYFYLCFKASASQPPGSWSIKIVPNAFELQKNA